jgi:hypothetical protein
MTWRDAGKAQQPAFLRTVYKGSLGELNGLHDVSLIYSATDGQTRTVSMRRMALD